MTELIFFVVATMGLSKKGKLKEETEAKTFELGSVKCIRFLVLIIWKRGMIPLTLHF